MIKQNRNTSGKPITQLLFGSAGSRALVFVTSLLLISACSTKPISPFDLQSEPLVLVPASQAGVIDSRGRFREVFCTVLETRGRHLPDYKPCEDVLLQVGAEPAKENTPIELGISERKLVAAVVPGVGWDCFSDWLNVEGTTQENLRLSGFDLVMIKVDGLSSSGNNARQIRDAIMAYDQSDISDPRLVLIGYSKGAPDVLEAVVDYPEIRDRVAAVVSVGGAVGGSPLANDAKESQLALLRNWPGADCAPGDGGAIEDLRPTTRQSWMARNQLPDDFPYFSLVTFPEPSRISRILRPSYNTLSRIDARNDSQLLFWDQVIPNSVLLGYLNADHWAVAVPIARSHSFLGATFVNKNDFPREAMVEAILRFVELELSASAE